jgi:protein gp37
MGQTTGIQWTDATWNPWYGCRKVSAGCKFCYMFRDMKRYGKDPNVVQRAKAATFDAPLRWKDPQRVFTCSWSDFYIEEADQWRVDARDIIERTPQHTYQILTKRIERVNETWFENVWLGVSIENRSSLDRIDILRTKSAGLRFLSIEPLLEDLGAINLDGIDWVIVGGESGGSEARPFGLGWARSVIAQCEVAGVACFVKQLGTLPIIESQELLGKTYDGKFVVGKCAGVNGNAVSVCLDDHKGGDWDEWPKDLRVRQFPESIVATRLRPIEQPTLFADPGPEKYGTD